MNRVGSRAWSKVGFLVVPALLGATRVEQLADLLQGDLRRYIYGNQAREVAALSITSQLLK